MDLSCDLCGLLHNPFWNQLVFCIILALNSNFLLTLDFPTHMSLQGGSRTSIAGGALVTNEAEGFTEARSAERGRVGRGSPPPAGRGPGGLPWEVLGNLHQNGAFWAHLEVTDAHIYNWKYIWKNVSHYKHIFS